VGIFAQGGDNEVFALLLEWFNFPTVPMQAEVQYSSTIEQEHDAHALSRELEQ